MGLTVDCGSGCGCMFDGFGDLEKVWDRVKEIKTMGQRWNSIWWHVKGKTRRKRAQTRKNGQFILCRLLGTPSDV